MSVMLVLHQPIELQNRRCILRHTVVRPGSEVVLSDLHRVTRAASELREERNKHTESWNTEANTHCKLEHSSSVVSKYPLVSNGYLERSIALSPRVRPVFVAFGLTILQ